MAEEAKTQNLEPMEDWRLWRGKSDPTVLLVVRDTSEGEGERKVEVKRLGYETFDLYPEDLTENYERVY